MPKTINQWLREATNRLQAADIKTARLDALVLLADALARDKAWLLAHGEQEVDAAALKHLNDQLDARLKRTPLAYIRGKQEFFGRSFTVSADVLIPRPETETLIELLSTLNPRPGDGLADIGTGSGAIAITARLEHPTLKVIATDVSTAALALARKNAAALGADIQFIEQSLLERPLPEPVRFVIANLPYVAKSWERSPETNFEPSLALFADEDGLALIKQLLSQSVRSITDGGYLLLEADPRQHHAIRDFAATQGYQFVTAQDFALCLQKKS